jgi:hypothetical protein
MKPIKFQICREGFTGHEMSGKSLLEYPGLLRWAERTVAKMGRPEDHNQSIKDVKDISEEFKS